MQMYPGNRLPALLNNVANGGVLLRNNDNSDFLQNVRLYCFCSFGDMNIFESNYYKPCRVLLSLIGQWPLQDRKVRIFRKIAVVFVLLMTIIVQVGKLLTSDMELEILVAIIPTMIINVDTIMICYSYHFRSNQIKDMLKVIECDWQKWEKHKDVGVMHKHAGDAAAFANFYIFYVYACITAIVVIPLLPEALDIVAPRNESRRRMHPFKAEYLVDEQKYFHLILLHMSISAYVILTAMTASDVTFVIYVQHACGKFAFVRKCILRTLTGNGNLSLGEETATAHQSKRSTYQNIVACIQLHRRAIAFVSMIEGFYSWQLLIQIGLNIVCMTFTLAKITLWLGDEAEMMMTITWVFGQLVHMLIMSYPGQLLLNHSQELFNQLYENEWYNVSVTTQKLLLFTMRRCLEPSYITVGKLFVLCLENYVTIIQTSVSYCMALSSLQGT